MINHSTLPNKTRKTPIYYLWTKWNQPYHQVRGSTGHPVGNTIQYNESTLPTVKLCCNEIMKRGLETEGLFRQSGATSQVHQLQQAIFERPNLDLSRYDIHTITSFLKKYLQHLPTPVIPPAYHDDFLRQVNQPHQMIDLIGCLPSHPKQLLDLVLTLVGGIQRHVEFNRMDPEALAVILAPVCTGLVTADLHQWIQTNAQWTRIWEWMIEHHTLILSSLHTQPVDVSSWYGDQLGYTITPPEQHLHSSFLSSGVTFSCRKSSHGFIRRLTSLSSLR